MKKLSTKQYIELFSQARINSYTSIDEHEQNFQMLDKISSKLARIEIIIRNKIDRKMRKSNENWMFDLPSDIKLDDDNGKIKDRDILVSRQTFGFWVKVVENYEIYDSLFDESFLKSFLFKKYSEFNREKVGKNYLYTWQKAYVILTLLKNIRNRAFHFENLFKLNSIGQPRLNTFVSFKTGYVIAGVKPNKITELLDDILWSFAPKWGGVSPLNQ